MVEKTKDICTECGKKKRSCNCRWSHKAMWRLYRRTWLCIMWPLWRILVGWCNRVLYSQERRKYNMWALLWNITWRWRNYAKMMRSWIVLIIRIIISIGFFLFGFYMFLDDSSRYIKGKLTKDEKRYFNIIETFFYICVELIPIILLIPLSE